MVILVVGLYGLAELLTAKKVNPYCFSTSCAINCGNKACFVSFECDTCSTSQACNIQTVIEYSIG